MMRAFAAWLMQSRRNALLGAAALGGLRLLDLLSGAVIALATLVQGPLEGLRVALLAMGLLAAAALVFSVPAGLVLGPLAVAWVPAWLLAGVLRQTGSLAAAVQAGVGLAVGALLAFHVAVDDPVGLWRALIDTWVVPALRELRGAVPLPDQLDAMARLAGGLVAAMGLLGAVCSLLLARWGQALLVKPGGFGTEFRAFRNGRTTTVVASAVFVAALFVEHLVLANVAVVLLVPFLLQGLAVAHRVVQGRDLGVGWLVALYAAALLMPLHIWALLAGVGFADNWWDIDAGGAPRPGP